MFIMMGNIMSVQIPVQARKKFTILIVDDNEFFRETLKTTLQSSFPTTAIDEAGGGGKVLQKVDTVRPDLIFMDIQLSGESGLELTKKIKASHPNITIFILTGYDIPEYREAALQYGADRFLDKSSLNRMGLEELVKIYQKVYESRNQRSPLTKT
jgi:DNA-binding NarL/FixJ family response regulator